MWEKIKNSRSFYVVISILLAIASWLYVDAQNPDASVTINNIPVSYVGDEHLEDENLLILDEAPTINVKVSGPRSVITQLNRNNIKITASASEITAAGVYSLDCTINLPSSVTSTSSSPVRITSRSASAIDVTVVKMVFGPPLQGGTFREQFEQHLDRLAGCRPLRSGGEPNPV